MKKCVWVVVFVLAGMPASRVWAQAQELQQLALNIEKLAQFRQILADMKKGYEILTKGYNAVKNISQGNFELHKVFLDGLMQVSPAVRQYRRVADIVNYQVSLVKEYKQAFKSFNRSGSFSAGEMVYIGGVYERLFDASLENLEDLLTVLTANRLRMSDEERLTEIDKIYNSMEDKLVFLRDFNNSTSILSLQRRKEKIELQRLQQINGIR
ncbi:MAG: TerB family tellurite resistance protein [Pseudobacter sp.]|uniref:TerB family tellurite resistance protein n=1 Tax=Pseudobacter sp. TaxID=2045420 RepID=UPI003F7EFFDE